MRLAVLMVFTLAPALTPASAQPDMEAGRRSYEVCAGCHGFVGQGSRIAGAPRLAGVETWYLERQIQNFKAERRGHVEGDTSGRRMLLMAQSVENERELGDVLAWIGALPAPPPPVPATEGSAEAAEASRGASLYGLCAACHGTDGRGNASLGAPSLVSLDDWYIAEQLERYADGRRGTHPADTYGAQMRALAASFDTGDERQALVGFIDTLRHGR